MNLIAIAQFQFLDGAIKSFYLQSEKTPADRFQFLDGAIKSWGLSQMIQSFPIVSIP